MCVPTDPPHTDLIATQRPIRQPDRTDADMVLAIVISICRRQTQCVWPHASPIHPTVRFHKLAED
jgi:hypothetical protein